MIFGIKIAPNGRQGKVPAKVLDGFTQVRAALKYNTYIPLGSVFIPRDRYMIFNNEQRINFVEGADVECLDNTEPIQYKSTHTCSILHPTPNPASIHTC
jgi:hypothetical protein